MREELAAGLSGVDAHLMPPRVQRALLTLLPITALDLVLFVLPMAVMAAVSLLQLQEFDLTRHLTLGNYAFFFQNWIYLRLLAKTMVIAFVVTVLCLLFGYPFAYFLVRLSPRWQRTMLVMVILPFWTSYLLRVYAWMTILGERGVVNSGLMLLGVVEEPVRFLLYNNFSTVTVFFYLYLPYSVLALYAALERLDRSLVSAAMDLGATPVQAFLHVVLPLTLPGIVASFIFVFIPMLGEYITPTLVGGADGIMIVNIVVSQFQALRFGIGSAMAFIVATLVLFLLLALGRTANLERIFGG